MLPISLGAACAAALLHIVVFFWAPSVLHLNFDKLFEAPERVQDEEMRVVVKERPEDELDEAKEEEPPPPVEEIQEIEHEPLEIDILDAEMEDVNISMLYYTYKSPNTPFGRIKICSKF